MTTGTTRHGGRTMTRRGKQALFVAIVAATILLPADADGILPLPPPSASAVPDGPGGGGGLPSPRGRSLRDGISRFRGRDLTTRRRGGHDDDAAAANADADARTDAQQSGGGRDRDPGREGESKEGIVASDAAVGLKPVLSPPTRPRPTRPTRPGQQQQVSFMVGTGSCAGAGSCGGSGSTGTNCWCDNLCFTTYNDCCDDACKECACEVCGADGPCSHSTCVGDEGPLDGYCGTPPPPSPPDVPTGLAAALLGVPQVGVRLTWSAASGGSGGPATGFSIHRRTDTGSLAEIGQVTGGTTTTYDDATTLGTGTYHYAVTATNDGGESSFSNEASVMVGPPPEAQLSCVPAATGGSSSVVQGGSEDWTCTVTSLNGYENTLAPSCDSSNPSGFTCSFVPTMVSVPADGTVDTTLAVSVGVGVSPSAYDLLVDASDGGSAAVEASTTVSVSVTAAASSEPSGSPSSGPSSAPSSGPSGSPSSLLSQPPSESVVPSASPSSQPSSDPSSMPSGSPSSGPSSAPSSLPSQSPSSLHSQPPSESVVPSEAPSSDPSSDPSSMPSGSPSAGPSSGPSGTPLPDAPGNLVATLVGGDRVELVWGEPPSGTPLGGYKVHRRDDVGGSLVEIGQISGGTTTTYSDTNLPGPGTYHYAVAAVNSAGVEGALSDEASVTWNPPPTCTDQVAVHDAGMGVPACSTAGCSCDSGGLLVGREDNGPEPNQPNTLDGCEDGGSGGFHSDESLDRIVVRSTGDGFIRAGSTVDIVATVWAWTTFTADHADFYHSEDANAPNWTLIGTIDAADAGEHELTQQFTLPEDSSSSATTQQAVRVNFRFNGSPNPCTGGNYDDRDDLVFAVAAAEEESECTANGDCPAGSVCGAGGVCSSSRPSSSPSGDPSASPSDDPSAGPSSSPSGDPSSQPSDLPSGSPSTGQSESPSESASPSARASASPSSSPSGDPSASPSGDPSSRPSSSPSGDPSSRPSPSPSGDPSAGPTSDSQCTLDPPPQFGYTGDPDGCDVEGPDPDSDCIEVVMKFYAFGDTPYGPADDTNDEFRCVNETLLPGLNKTVADFIAHVGDIRKGSHCCTYSDFQIRKNMFHDGTEAAGLDCFIVPGDNEWNDCGDKALDDCDEENVPESDRIDTEAKAIAEWRRLFGSETGSETDSHFDVFHRLDLPSGVTAPPVERQDVREENFFFTYKDVGFWGINEAAGYSDSEAHNALWVKEKLESNQNIEAIVIIGHSGLSGDVRDELEANYLHIPMLYVRGNSHDYCVHKGISSLPDLIQVTVDEGEAAPLLISVLRDVTTGMHYFHVERRFDQSCSGAAFKDSYPMIKKLDSDDRYDFKLEALKKLETERERGRMHRKED